MRRTYNIIFFLALLLLHISFTVAAGVETGKAVKEEGPEKVWIFTIKKEHRKHKDLAAMHRALEEADEKPPWGGVFDSADLKWGTFFMTVNCTEEKGKEIKSKFSHLISGFANYKDYREPLYTAHEAPGYALDTDINQRHERLMLLQEQGKEVPSKYYYHKSQGQGVTVYFVDTGINRKHPEFVDADKDGRIEVLFADPLPPRPEKQAKDVDSSLRFSHGSSVAGVVVGKITGLAPKAKIVMVAALDRNSLSSEALYLSALMKVYNHITTHNKNNKVILNLSMNAGYLRERKSAIDTDIRDGLELVFADLTALPNLIITSASGVSEWSQKGVAWSWPNVKAASQKTAKNLIIVGGVDQKGNGIFQKPEKDFQQVFAPAYAVKIASNVGYQLTTGTSFASAYAAGVLANYLSKNVELTAQEAINLLIQRSFPRIKGGPNVVWSGVTQQEAGVTLEQLKAICKRADGKDCERKFSETDESSTKTPTESPEEIPEETPVSTPQGKEDGGFPDPDDEEPDEEDNPRASGVEDDDSSAGVSFVATTTLLKEVGFNVYITVGVGAKPSATNKNDIERVDPLADPKDPKDTEDRNFRRAEGHEPVAPTQPRSSGNPYTTNLAFETSTADKPLSKS
ncbi:Suppressor of the cold-sensitive snRNP biogenesis mutant brr1-1 [Arthrobotrys conoides]|uniref:Suppressor of the cold-sensitive snRNP biogenesis mutant brr1-1 n=1 Tax=Arthrobotrys conoides TaxID=74498 RepID=A0AAN8N9T8_9PEZI